jgi:hypothetical protein
VTATLYYQDTKMRTEAQRLFAEPDDQTVPMILDYRPGYVTFYLFRGDW